MITVKPHIYVCTPLRPVVGDPGWIDADDKKQRALALKANVEFAERVCHLIALAGGVPYAPHLLFPRFLNDEVREERDLGIAMGLAELARKDELWATLPPWRTGLSTGMTSEFEGARSLGIPALSFSFIELEAHLARLRAGDVPILDRTVIKD